MTQWNAPREQGGIDLDEIRQRFVYDAATGQLSFRKAFGRRRAGTVAGTPTRCGYLRISVNHRRVMAHRLIWFYVTGKWPTNLIDHINGNKTDNRIENLREATCSQNNAARRFQPPESGFRGVTKNYQRWHAQMRINGKTKYIGAYATREDAAAAYSEAMKQYFGEFAPD